MTALLSCTALSKRLGGKVILDALDVDVQPAEVVALLGASGSGKTTLLRLIAGLLMPDQGQITLQGRVIWSPSIAVPVEKRQIGMVFQDYALWPHMTVEGNLSFGLRAQRLSAADARARVDHALDVTRLGELRDRMPATLSGGQQQRVAIARCLAARPALMLFDEPLSNLDAALREDMRVEMMDLVRREGTTVVYVTHDQAEALAVTDRIAVMRDGTIAQFDTPQRIYDAPANPFVASFIGGFSLLSGQAAGGVFRAATGASLATGGDLTGPAFLVVRPEDVRPAQDFPHTVLTGRVHSAAFQGRCWRLGVQIGQARVRLDWPEPVAVGSELAFSLPPARCVVLAG